MHRNYVILDLEATCWERGTQPSRMETIEFGAVELDRVTLEPRREFSRFVRPIVEPLLSEFCTKLTGITQKDVEHAPMFPEVFGEFLTWLGDGAITLCTWGNYDIRQLKIDCRRYGVLFPYRLENYLNLKKMFAAAHGIKPCGMKRALQILNIQLDGRHHRAIDDVRNIAKVAATILAKNGNEQEHDA